MPSMKIVVLIFLCFEALAAIRPLAKEFLQKSSRLLESQTQKQLVKLEEDVLQSRLSWGLQAETLWLKDRLDNLSPTHPEETKVAGLEFKLTRPTSFGGEVEVKTGNRAYAFTIGNNPLLSSFPKYPYEFYH